ncbi:MAG: hypothetical protein WAV13_15510, partial [Thermodesulfovibrionales bacterium]
TVNGIKMVVPCNTILQMPAASFTWAHLFDPAISAPINPLNSVPPAQGAGQTGLSLSDAPARFPSFDVRVIGNIVPDPASTPEAPLPDRYIIGLIVPISQQGLNRSSGLISFIDYATGAFRVGGLPQDPNCTSGPGGGPFCSGALVQINDPVGRFGLAHSHDPRFTSDTNNPTVRAFSGYPLCIPRVAPPAIDPLCPITNRPLNGDPNFPADPFLAIGAPLRYFDMPAPGTPGIDPEHPIVTDPTQQVPLTVGDWVDYSGTLVKLNPAGANDHTNTYISIHTLDAQLGIYTAPSVPPSYIGAEAFLIGTGGQINPNINTEITTRIRITGSASDPLRNINVYAKDVNPCTGKITERFLFSSTPLNGIGNARGHFNTALPGGSFMPPTREVRARYSNLTAETVPTVANGLKGGQFDLPNFEFISAATITRGQPVVPFNFQDMPILVLGSGPLNGDLGGPVVGQLDPWPGLPVPPKAICNAGGLVPIANAGANFTTGSGNVVILNGSALCDSTGDPNCSIANISWSQTGGPTVALAAENTFAPSFTAPAVLPGLPPVVLTFTLTVSDQFGSSSSSVTVTVMAIADTVVITSAAWRDLKGGRLDVVATTNSPAATLTVTEIVAATGAFLDLGAMDAISCLPVVPPPGTYCLGFRGVAAPSSVTVNSSFGGAATVNCTPDPGRPGSLVCQ